MAQTRVQLNEQELGILIRILEPNVADLEDIKLLTKLKRSYVTVGGSIIDLGGEPIKKVSSTNEIDRINSLMLNDQEISDEDKALYYQLTGTEL